MKYKESVKTEFCLDHNCYITVYTNINIFTEICKINQTFPVYALDSGKSRTTKKNINKYRY